MPRRGWRKPATEDLRRQVMRLAYRGYTCTEVAGICDISVQMVYQLRRDVRRNTDRARAARWKALATRLRRQRDALRALVA